MGKGSFILYDIDLESVRFLTKEQVAEFFIASVDNILDGNSPDFGNDSALKLLYHQITSHIALNEEKYKALSNKRSEAAKKRWNKTDANECKAMQNDAKLCLYDTDTVTVTDTDTDTDTVTVTDTVTDTVTVNNYSINFENIYKEYPRKGDKKKSYACFLARLKEGYSEEELLTATRNYADYCKKEKREEKYIKMASTFFGVNTPFVDFLKGGDSDDGNNTKTEYSDEEIEEFKKLL
jgi:hypothetical protein